MSDDSLRKVLVGCLHTIYDDLLHSLLEVEKVLKLFGEDMSWYEQWRKEKQNKQKEG
jgi:hypothetical protein